MKLNEHLSQLLLAMIMGIISLGVSYMRDMAKEIQTISSTVSESRAESGLKFNNLYDIVKDHEGRIRIIEKHTKHTQGE